MQAIALAAGELQLGDEHPPSWAGFPPALLPLTETESGIERGYWKHWFLPERRVSIVELYGQTLFGRPLIAMEIARNFTQFLYVQMLQEAALFGHISANSQQLVEVAGIPDIEWLISVANERGDDLEFLREHPCFRDDPPQSCFNDLSLYSGDFPKPMSDEPPGTLRYGCGYEIHSRFGNGNPDPEQYRRRVASSSALPAWLRTATQGEVFRQLLVTENLAGAWLSLNSPGWRFDEARVAIRMLSEKAADYDFTLLAEAWCSLPHEQRMGETY